MPSILKRSKKEFEELQAKQRERGQGEGCALPEDEGAKRAAAKFRRRGRLSREKLHRRITI